MIDKFDYRKIEFVLIHVLTRLVKNKSLLIQHKHHTSMIHDGVNTPEHVQTLIEINNIKQYYIDEIDANGIENLKDELLGLAEKYYSLEKGSFIPTISKSTISDIRDCFQIELIELNRREDEVDGLELEKIPEFPQDLDYFEETEGVPGRNYIITGGHRISRGLTLEGLTISFFLRRPNVPNYDTMLQLARWCGYRDGYSELVRIITTPTITEDYRLINEAEYNMRWQLERMDHCSDPVEKVIWIQQQPNLKISGKMPLPAFLNHFTEYGRNIQREIWTQDVPELYLKNDCSFKLFHKLHYHLRSKFTNPPKKEGNNVTNYKVAFEVDCAKVRDFLSSYHQIIPQELGKLKSQIGTILDDIDDYPLWNIALNTPSTRAYGEYIVPSTKENLKLVKRTPNQSNKITQVYSGYPKSVQVDLEEIGGIIQERKKPLLIFYLASPKKKNGEYIFKGCKFPIPLFGVIMPIETIENENREWVSGIRPFDVDPPEILGDENE